jgi:hypothetical protein
MYWIVGMFMIDPFSLRSRMIESRLCYAAALRHSEFASLQQATDVSCCRGRGAEE